MSNAFLEQLSSFEILVDGRLFVFLFGILIVYCFHPCINRFEKNYIGFVNFDFTLLL